MLRSSVSRRALETVAVTPKIGGFGLARTLSFFAGKTCVRAACPAAQTPLYVRPPHRDHSPGPGWHGTQQSLKALIWRVLFVLSPKQSGAAAAGFGRKGAAAFAPFVYRLGRHPFTVERAVRFR
jgi:hypothetical protein